MRNYEWTKQEQREAEFVGDWQQTHDTAPTFADAIEWQRAKDIEKVKAMLDNYIRQLQVEGRPHDAIMLITGKQEAALRILELLMEK